MAITDVRRPGALPGIDALRYHTDALDIAAQQLAERAPPVVPVDRRRPCEDTGDSECADALTAFYTAHDRAVTAVTADQLASAEHLRLSARAYAAADDYAATVLHPGHTDHADTGPAPDGAVDAAPAGGAWT